MFGREKKTRRKEKKKCCVFFRDEEKKLWSISSSVKWRDPQKDFVCCVSFSFSFSIEWGRKKSTTEWSGGRDSGYNLQPGRNFFKNVDSLFDLVNQRGDFHYPILKENRETHTHTNMSSSTLFTRANVGIVSKLIEQSKQNKIIFSFIPERF